MPHTTRKETEAQRTIRVADHRSLRRLVSTIPRREKDNRAERRRERPARREAARALKRERRLFREVLPDGTQRPADRRARVRASRERPASRGRRHDGI